MPFKIRLYVIDYNQERWWLVWLQCDRVPTITKLEIHEMMLSSYNKYNQIDFFCFFVLSCMQTVLYVLKIHCLAYDEK